MVKLVGGALFPIGLMLVILSGTELYTGNTAFVPMAVFEGKVSGRDVVGTCLYVCACAREVQTGQGKGPREVGRGDSTQDS